MKIDRTIIVIIIIAVIFLGLFLRYSDRAPKRHYSDFRVYYATGGRFAEKEDIYARPEESITPFKYSPLFAMLMWPFSYFSQEAASLVFFSINFISLIIIFVLSGELVIRDEISFKQKIFLYSATAVSSLRFILHALDSGQVGIIILALVVSGLYLLDKKKDTISAALIGLSTMIKYTPVVFLPYFIFRKKIKIIPLIILFVMIFCLIPACYVGMDKAIEYLKDWIPSISGTSFDAGSWYDYKNQSIFSLVLRYFTVDSPYDVSVGHLTFNQGLLASVIACVLIYLLIIFPKNSTGLRGPIEYSLLFIAMTLFNPNAWMHNFVAFIFVYMTLFYYLIKTNFKDRVVLTLVVLSFILMTLTSELFVGDNLEKLFERLSFLTIGALGLLFSLFKLKFHEEEV